RRGKVGAVEDGVRVLRPYDLRQDRRVIDVLWLYTAERCDGTTGLFNRRPGDVSHTLPHGLLVTQDREPLRSQLPHSEGHDRTTLDVVTRDDTDQMLPALLRDRGIRGYRDHRQVHFADDRRTCQGRTGTEVTDESDVPRVVGDLRGHWSRLLR